MLLSCFGLSHRLIQARPCVNIQKIVIYLPQSAAIVRRVHLKLSPKRTETEDYTTGRFA